LLAETAVARRDAWTPPRDWPGHAREQTFGDERATTILSGEITSPRNFPRNDSPPPEGVFGDYAIHEQLGTGGMASVHRAERRVGGVRQRVALKRMLPNAAAEPELVKLFLDEARLVSLLRHRNIAEVYDFGRVGEDYFLAMELVAGPTLKQLLRHCAATVGLIPYPIALNLLIQVCDALAYAHDHRDASGKPLHLVHRDVSPSNIVISSNGVVKLIDFGVAKTTSTHTQAGIIKGKLGYIAPEYLAETGLDRRSDLWAVGVIAYELLCNQRLFTADDDFEVMQQIRSLKITPPSVHNPDVPAELEAIVMTALEREPVLRWQNAKALRNALAGVARPSTNAEVMEWVDFVFALGDAPRPVRGSRPLTAPRAPSIDPTAFDELQRTIERPKLEEQRTIELPRFDEQRAKSPRPEQRAKSPKEQRAPRSKAADSQRQSTQELQRAIERPSFDAIELVAAQPMVPIPRQLPLPAMPTPKPLITRAPMSLRPARQAMPTIGAAMIARRRQRRLFAPLLLILLGGIASALAVPAVYEAFLR
jgi:serine/threonine protein kinase